MADNLNIVHLRRGKEESLRRYHPWVFSGAIERISEGITPLAEGDIVDVVTKQGEFIARGHWQVGSIAVRVLTFEKEDIDQMWWNRRIAEALHVREALGLKDNTSTTCSPARESWAIRGQRLKRRPLSGHCLDLPRPSAKKSFKQSHRLFLVS